MIPLPVFENEPHILAIYCYYYFRFLVVFFFFGKTIIIINISLIGYANIPNYKDIELNKKIYKIYLLSILNLETYWQM